MLPNEQVWWLQSVRRVRQHVGAYFQLMQGGMKLYCWRCSVIDVLTKPLQLKL